MQILATDHRPLTTVLIIRPRKPIIAGALFFMLHCLMSSAHAQGRQVANYSFGKVGTQNYERFSFWTRGDAPGEIDYSYGRDWKEVKLTYAGAGVLNGESGFKAQFPNGHTIYIIPQGYSLKVVDREGKYSKRFRWEYEGPVNGRGTWCEACAADEKEAMRLIKRYYMK